MNFLDGVGFGGVGERQCQEAVFLSDGHTGVFLNDFQRHTGENILSDLGAVETLPGQVEVVRKRLEERFFAQMVEFQQALVERFSGRLLMIQGFLELSQGDGFFFEERGT